jgi:CSLREA domain-containing protein
MGRVFGFAIAPVSGAQQGKRFLKMGLAICIALALIPITPLPSQAAGVTFVVNSTGDGADASIDGACGTAGPLVGNDPECTLRAAIQEANAAAGADTIDFSIPGSGVQTIAPSTELPTVTQPVVIDGYTQPGATQNTLAEGSDATLKIELSGANDPATSSSSAVGLEIQGGTSSVRGLVINRWTYGVILESAGGDTLEGNFLGTDATGTSASQSTATFGSLMGVAVSALANNTIGGTTPGARNVISGHGYGIYMSGGATGNSVQGNLIGTNAAGTADIPNVFGLYISASAGNTIGGTSSGAGNVISGNGDGVHIFYAPSGNLIQGNLIGTQADGTSPLGNGDGVLIESAPSNTVGGTDPAASNVLAFNGVGVRVTGDSAVGNVFLGNEIFASSSLGIDLGDDGVTPNDAQDPDTGPNNRQNFPNLNAPPSATSPVTGMLNSTPSSSFRMEFFVSSQCHTSGYGEGGRFLEAVEVTTDANGDATFSEVLEALQPGDKITATATSLVNDLPTETSEFSACVSTPPKPKDPVPLLCRSATGPGVNVIVGTEGDDHLVGTEANDVMCGGGGNDTILGHGGDDAITGNSGNDEITGGLGADNLYGRKGGDGLGGSGGRDQISGGRGADVLLGFKGNDSLRGRAGNDLLKGGAGSDYCNGGLGNDALVTCESGPAS